MIGEGAKRVVHEVAAAHRGNDRFGVVAAHGEIGVFHAIPGVGHVEPGFGQPVGAEVGEVRVTHQAQAGIAPGCAFKVLHHLPVQGGVTGEDVLPACLQQVVERMDDALEVGPGALEDVEGLGGRKRSAG